MNLLQTNSQQLIFSCGEKLIFSDPSSNDNILAIPPLPQNPTKQKKILKEDRSINALALSSDQEYIAVSTENKQVVVFDKSKSVIKNFIIARVASKIIFSHTNDIIVADKTGDVYLYKLEDEKDEPVLLLGHLSMILDVVFSDCGKYLITCDRDEKIRISLYPNCYNIVSFCLGHTEFVINVKVIRNILVSASGDGTVRFWNFVKGEQLGIINTNGDIPENTLIEKFSSVMKNEKIDVTTLPISNMEVCEVDNFLFIIVSLHSLNGVQIYKTDLNTFSSTFFKQIKVEHSPFIFNFSNNLLYVISDRLSLYDFVDKDFKLRSGSNDLLGFYEKHNNCFQIVDDGITVLYKKKFDNVQEYLERKKARLESDK